MNIPFTAADPRTSKWLKRMGAVGFAFFLIKGLLWLAVPLFLHSVWGN